MFEREFNGRAPFVWLLCVAAFLGLAVVSAAMVVVTAAIWVSRLPVRVLSLAKREQV